MALAETVEYVEDLAVVSANGLTKTFTIGTVDWSRTLWMKSIAYNDPDTRTQRHMWRDSAPSATSVLLTRHESGSAKSMQIAGQAVQFTVASGITVVRGEHDCINGLSGNNLALSGVVPGQSFPIVSFSTNDPGRIEQGMPKPYLTTDQVEFRFDSGSLSPVASGDCIAAVQVCVLPPAIGRVVAVPVSMASGASTTGLHDQTLALIGGDQVDPARTFIVPFVASGSTTVGPRDSLTTLSPDGTGLRFRHQELGSSYGGFSGIVYLVELIGYAVETAEMAFGAAEVSKSASLSAAPGSTAFWINAGNYSDGFIVGALGTSTSARTAGDFRFKLNGSAVDAIRVSPAADTAHTTLAQVVTDNAPTVVTPTINNVVATLGATDVRSITVSANISNGSSPTATITTGGNPIGPSAMTNIAGDDWEVIFAGLATNGTYAVTVNDPPSTDASQSILLNAVTVSGGTTMSKT